MDPSTDVDKILTSLGKFGKYQKIQLLIILICNMENCFHLISTVYIGFRPTYRCDDINTTLYLEDRHINVHNVSHIGVNYQKCAIEITTNISDIQYRYTEVCINGYKYDIGKDMSTVTEWNLFCNGAQRSEFAQTLVMIGQAVGALIFSPIADRFGRKPANVAARILYFTTALATVFAPNIEAFSVFRFLQGTFQGGSVMTCTILYIEILPKEIRHITEGLASTTWTTGLVFVSVVGYLLRDFSWRYLQLILALVSCHALFDWLFLDESLRWLMANNKYDQTEKLLRKAARINNVNYESVIENTTMSIRILKSSDRAVVEDQDQMPNVDHEKTKVEKYTILTVMKHKRMLLSSIVLWIAWITNTLTYFGLMLTTSKLSGDRYLNNIIASLAEYPAVIMQQLLINRIGRISLLIIFHGIAGVSLVLATICSTYEDKYTWLPILSTVFSFIGRFAITGSFSTVFVYTPELYPTNLRNVGLGMASTISRLGSMLSPFAITLADYVFWGPAAVFATLNVIVTVTLLFLPETMGRTLPTTVNELKTWHKDKKTTK